MVSLFPHWNIDVIKNSGVRILIAGDRNSGKTHAVTSFLMARYPQSRVHVNTITLSDIQTYGKHGAQIEPNFLALEQRMNDEAQKDGLNQNVIVIEDAGANQSRASISRLVQKPSDYQALINVVQTVSDVTLQDVCNNYDYILLLGKCRDDAIFLHRWLYKDRPLEEYLKRGEFNTRNYGICVIDRFGGHFNNYQKNQLFFYKGVSIPELPSVPRLSVTQRNGREEIQITTSLQDTYDMEIVNGRRVIKITSLLPQ
jgi:GTPase SAR1 family protein